MRKPQTLCESTVKITLSKSVYEKVSLESLRSITCNGYSVFDSFVESITKNEPWSTLTIASLATASALFVVMLLTLAIVYPQWQHKRRALMQWLLNESDVTREGKDYEDDDVTYRLANWDHSPVALFPASHLEVPSRFGPKSVQLLAMAKGKVNHANVLKLIGVVMAQREVKMVYEFSPKGTLHQSLLQCRYTLTNRIKSSLIIDTVNGLSYLHAHGIIHGYFSSLTCFVDANWTPKVGNWVDVQLAHFQTPTQVKTVFDFIPRHIPTNKIIRLIYIDPRNGDLEKPDIAADIYSLGLLIAEVFLRQVPYMDRLTSEQEACEFLEVKFSRCFISPLSLNSTVPPDVAGLIQTCLVPPESRPSLNTVKSVMWATNPGNASIVDIMMEAMENHMDTLEEKVEERTTALLAVTSKMEDLLNEMLPSSIAKKLLQGEIIQPEYFECATIYFSDIVGFTDICGVCSPFQVMAFLNDLWTMFDATIERFDAYKVDTIGDAYMVSSGLPNKNGFSHSKQIALLALALREKVIDFKIRELQHQRIQIRIGINSGPVTAGIVGSKMPQYCVFGDAVNTAARMESTSETMKIQVSYQTHLLLETHFASEFNMENRGTIDVKGKGKMATYWLHGINQPS